ncbi:MAG TPA: glycosyltransferase family 4 protein [Pyrinomonadaceae bacterium]|nr:glycosyltransferase family 4 protein [Pyrinomonadaceae bacterium]
MAEHTSTLRILSIVEATTINAVAKSVLGFFRSARELNQQSVDFPVIDGSFATFERRREDDHSPNEFVTAARESGFQIDVIPERRRFDLSVIPALRKIVEDRQPDIVVTNSVKSHFLLWRSRLWKDFPWIAFHHGYTDTDRKMRVYNRLDRWSLPRADRLVTVCRVFAQELSSTTGVPLERISVQHNSIRPQPRPSADEVQALKERLGIANGERMILAVGRLSKEKAHIDLLVAFKRLRETNPEINCKLIIVGDGPERGKLEAVVESFDLKESVIFTGQVRDVQTSYAVADAFALPSHSEGSPNVLLEAMAANLAVVATKVGGVPEIVVDSESALLVAANDPPALASAITRLLTDSELARRLTINASALAITKHSPEQYVRSLVEIYREVIDRRMTKRSSSQSLVQQ